MTESAKNNEAREAVVALPLPSWAADSSLLMGEAESLNAEAQEFLDAAKASYDAAVAAYEAGEY